MEKLFVGILNITLLVVGFIALLVAAGATAFAIFALAPSLFANTSSSNVSIHYAPVSEVSGTVSSAPGGDGSLSTTASPDIDKGAADVCKARSDFVDRVSNSQLSLDSGQCKTAVANDAESTWDSRALNFLRQSASYWHALLSDPQLQTKYSEQGKSSIDGYLDKIDAEIADKFAKEVSKDEKRKEAAEATVLAGRGAALVLAGVAASAFMSFLFIAFLIVATRIEKHLAGLERKAPEPSSTASA
jgi:hypothetical protein